MPSSSCTSPVMRGPRGWHAPPSWCSGPAHSGSWSSTSWRDSRGARRGRAGSPGSRNEHVAFVSEWWWATRKTRTWVLDPSNPDREPVLIDDRSYQDAYANPGRPLTTMGPHGRRVLRLVDRGNAVYMQGRGASPEGVRPFLDRLDLRSGAVKRLWQADDSHYERVVDVLVSKARRMITYRESRDEPRNYFVRRRGQKQLE